MNNLFTKFANIDKWETNRMEGINQKSSNTIPMLVFALVLVLGSFAVTVVVPRFVNIMAYDPKTEISAAWWHAWAFWMPIDKCFVK